MNEIWLNLIVIRLKQAKMNLLVEEIKKQKLLIHVDSNNSNNSNNNQHLLSLQKKKGIENAIFMLRP